MRRTAFVTTTLAVLLTAGLAVAQTSPSQPMPGPNARGTLPQPGGGVTVGPGAPSSASDSAMPGGRGAPSPGMSSPQGLGSGTGGSPLTPNGSIRPGNPTLGGQNNSGGG